MSFIYLMSRLWKNPPVSIFLLKVTISGGLSRLKYSWHHILPVAPTPVWTSSMSNPTPWRLAIFWRPWNSLVHQILANFSRFLLGRNLARPRCRPLQTELVLQLFQQLGFPFCYIGLSDLQLPPDIFHLRLGFPVCCSPRDTDIC